MRCSERFPISKLNVKGLFLLLFLPLSLCAKIIIELSPVVYVDKEYVTIAQIASVSGAQKEIVSFIQSIRVDLPKSEVSRLDKEDVKKVLRKNFIDLNRVEIKGDRVIIKRKLYHLEPEEIAAIVKKELKKEHPGIEILSLSFSRRPIKILRGGSLKKRLRIKSETKNRIYAALDLYVNGQMVKSLPITANVRFEKKVVAARRDIPSKKVITAEDLYMKKVTSSVYRSHYTDIKAVVGKVAKRSIEKDSIIKRNFIEPRYIVHKNRNVKIVYDRGPIKVELMGIALSNGVEGEIIPVKNISSGKVIKCEVIAPSTARFIK